MAGEFPLITTSLYRSEATQWLKTLARGEDVAVVFLPKTDRDIRLGQFLSDTTLHRKVLGRSDSYLFQTINFDAHDVEDIEDLYFQIEERLNITKLSPKPMPFLQWTAFLKKRKLTMVLILRETEKYLNATDKIVLSVLSDLVNRHAPVIRVITFFETDITHPSLFSFLPTSSTLYENVFCYPLYPHDATLAFINLLCHQWDPSLDVRMKEKILASCGGHFWLVKEAVRRIVASGSWSPDDEGTQFRLRSIYSLLLPTEQSVIAKTVAGVKGLTQQEALSSLHLTRMRLLDGEGRLLVGALKQFLLKDHQKVTSIKLVDRHILVNDVPVDEFFSRKELRVLSILLEHRGEIVSRDAIARRVWPLETSKQYSDWAIDQLVARVRKRLTHLSLPGSLVCAVRGRGYLVQ